jgi:hypothetical protein
MRIDESGQDHVSAAIDLDDLLAILLEPRIAQGVFVVPTETILPPRQSTAASSMIPSSESEAPRRGTVRSRAQREKLADIYQQESRFLSHCCPGERISTTETRRHGEIRRS